jgi:hypothetical protein
MQRLSSIISYPKSFRESFRGLNFSTPPKPIISLHNQHFNPIARHDCLPGSHKALTGFINQNPKGKPDETHHHATRPTDRSSPSPPIDRHPHRDPDLPNPNPHPQQQCPRSPHRSPRKTQNPTPNLEPPSPPTQKTIEKITPLLHLFDTKLHLFDRNLLYIELIQYLFDRNL